MRFEDYNLRMLREHQKFQGERGLRCQSLDEPCGKHVGGSFLRSALTETTAADHMSILEIGTRVLAGMSLLQHHKHARPHSASWTGGRSRCRSTTQPQ